MMKLYWTLFFGLMALFPHAAIGSEKYGYIDKTGNWVIQPMFENAQPFKNGFAVVEVRDQETNKVVRRQITHWGGYVHCPGILPRHVPYKLNEFAEHLDNPQPIEVHNELIKGEGYNHFYYNPLIATRAASQKNGTISFGEPALPLVFKEGLTPVLCLVPGGSAFGFMNRVGKLVIPAKYVHAYGFSEGVAAVSIGDIGFSPDEWMHTSPQSGRNGLMRKLFAQYNIRGMSRKKIHSLLGDPDSATDIGNDDLECYSLYAGWCANASSSLQIQYIANRVYRYRIIGFQSQGPWTTEGFPQHSPGPLLKRWFKPSI